MIYRRRSLVERSVGRPDVQITNDSNEKKSEPHITLVVAFKAK